VGGGLENRVALVTGGGKGIGAAVALRLAVEGARVAVLGRDHAAVDGIAREVNGLALVADVTDPAQMDAALLRLRDHWGDVSILVQNAGVATSVSLEGTTDAIWARTFDVNVTAPFRLARALVPAMVKSGWGRIVHVASNAGLTGYPYTAAYCASKHALVGLTRALAAELARKGVTVNAVCPGFVDTAMTTRAIATIAEKTKRTPEEARRELEAYNPQRRLVHVDEVAHLVATLCHDEARSINGQAIPVDGGQVMR
jgi:NAD(P)-dependent dehydrogenase (short-subunit alcohol dehydrogenase family)